LGGGRGNGPLLGSANGFSKKLGGVESQKKPTYYWAKGANFGSKRMLQVRKRRKNDHSATQGGKISWKFANKAKPKTPTTSKRLTAKTKKTKIEVSVR